MEVPQKLKIEPPYDLAILLLGIYANKMKILNQKTNKQTNKTGVNLCDLALGNNFLDVTPKAQVITENIDKMDFINLKKPFVLQGCHQGSKKTTHREKIFIKNISDSELVSRTHKVTL